jgi:hypothetical protein
VGTLSGCSGDAAGDIGDAVKGGWMTTPAGESGDAKEPKDPGGLWTLRSIGTLLDTGDSGDGKVPRDPCGLLR